jgi:adenylate kinase family enzyme
MEAIEEYFQKCYIDEKDNIKEISSLVNEVMKLFTICLKEKNEKGAAFGSPYEFKDKESVVLPKSYSCSTNAMILFLIGKMLNNIKLNSSIIPQIEWDFKGKDIEESSGVNSKDLYKKRYMDNIGFLAKIIESNISEKKILFNSGSFGKNDPFTFSWVAELITCHDDSKTFKSVKEEFFKNAACQISKYFKDPDKPILEFDLKGEENQIKRQPTNHIFPLLRIIHLYKTLLNNEDTKEKLPSIPPVLVENLHNRINQQISYFELKNGQFDTAELVMSIEGLLLIDDKKRIDDNLLTKVFEILEINQKINLNWRPLKPFVTASQGDVLLPLSIEIANSLLRVCKHLEKKKKYYFHKYFNIFSNYTQWLLSNVSQCEIKDEVYKGWRSEHVQKPDIIHPWETAQVIIYLMNYKSMVQDNIAYKSFELCNLSYNDKYLEELKEKSYSAWDKKWNVNETSDNCYKEIRDEYISSRINQTIEPEFSMLLYGPPGTGKTSIAEELAKALKWRLITITPSDFIKNGEADVEGRAKNVFKTLEEQKDCVILFDEIDRLILDRDSSYYTAQGDMFQFMTPSMLVKLKDLRSAKKCIFIIATNYEERIDSAIKRVGRIDHKYLINLPDRNQRKKMINDFLRLGLKGKSTEDVNSDKVKEAINKLVNDTVLYSYGELELLIKTACKKITVKDDLAATLNNTYSEQEEPTVKLSNYNRRFQTQVKKEKGNDTEKDLPIFSYNEFFSLVYLKVETKFDEAKFITKSFELEDLISALNGDENELVKKVITLDTHLDFKKSIGATNYEILKKFEELKA